MIFRIFIWTGFLAIILVFLYCNQFFSENNAPGIVCLELANASRGKEILALWSKTGLLSIARSITWFDFAFIFFYVAIIISLSNRQIRKEPSIFLNSLLRANFFFAAIAGLLDISENILLLYNTYQYDDGEYISTRLIAWPKFVLAGWTVLVWLISFMKTRVSS
jgi:hypothetical protein